MPRAALLCALTFSLTSCSSLRPDLRPSHAARVVRARERTGLALTVLGALGAATAVAGLVTAGTSSPCDLGSTNDCGFDRLVAGAWLAAAGLTLASVTLPIGIALYESAHHDRFALDEQAPPSLLATRAHRRNLLGRRLTLAGALIGAVAAAWGIAILVEDHSATDKPGWFYPTAQGIAIPTGVSGLALLSSGITLWSLGRW